MTPDAAGERAYIAVIGSSAWRQPCLAVRRNWTRYSTAS
ncbi:MAG: hypothetical protein JWQ97_2051, partial [Phenylobacterium sp.]|nr:hypothetical protein [Phenylobacterium sp.]